MIAIIDGCGANIASIQFALERLGQQSVLTSEIDVIKKASHVILPGVGAAKYAMEKLRQKKLVDVIKAVKQPILGICLGMQLFFKKSEEGDVDCLDIFSGEVVKLSSSNKITIPHMGWNQLQLKNKKSFLLKKY